MEVILNWKGKMSFEGLGDSGFVQKMDTDEMAGGENSAARPMEFLAIGLAGCTGMDVISILQKKKQAVTDFQVQVHAQRVDEHPKVISSAVIEYLVSGKDIDEAAVLRAIKLSAEKYCPAQAMLSKAFPMQLVYKIFGEDGKMLVKQGEYLAKQSIK
jgi:putative redox protein